MGYINTAKICLTYILSSFNRNGLKQLVKLHVLLSPHNTFLRLFEQELFSRGAEVYFRTSGMHISTHPAPGGTVSFPGGSRLH